MDMTKFKEQLIKWRHHLHMYPEWALEEKVTSDYIAKELEAMGYEVHRGIGVTGMVANLTCGDGKEVIGLRADFDAIGLQEMTDLPYKSKHDGMMHACGHDGHTATLLGTAMLLKERMNFNGTVRFIFQPGEEPGLGAAAMIKDGIFEKFPTDEIYAMHNFPGFEAGNIAICKGGAMASEDDFVIRVKGVGGHSSAPQHTIDPLVIAAEIIMSLQTIVARTLGPLDRGVVSCTDIKTDGTRNAIPSTVEISGDARCTDPVVRKILEKRIREISEGICKTHGAQCEIEYSYEFSPTVNSEKCHKHATLAAISLFGEDKVNTDAPPQMGAEDFGLFAEQIPGCYIFIGAGSEGCAPIHNSLYDYNDEILVPGAELFARLIEMRLPK